MNPAGRILGAATGAMFLSLALLPSRDARSSRPDRSETRAFAHADHVPRAWLTGAERLRDCRGCHAYSPGATRDPQATCGDCHFRGPFEPGVASGADPEFARSLDVSRRDDSPVFDHAEHGRLSCKECHAPETRAAVVPDPMPIRRGAAECARCHAPGAPRGDDKLEPDKFFDRINAAPSMGAEKLGPFSHADHLDDPGRCPNLRDLLGGAQGEASCLPCHAGTVTAKAQDFHGGLFDAGRCGACHSGEIASSATLEMGTQRRTSRSLLTFSHADHVKAVERRDPAKATEKAYGDIRDKACLACHAFDRAGGEGDDGDYSFARNRHPDTFEGCATCHSGAAWNPRHDAWEERLCTKCHAFGRGDMKKDRPTVSVRRIRAEKFRITGQAHPFITDADGTDADCGQCHLATVRKLPSRIDDRPFSHLTHLGPTPDSKACDACHAPAINASAGGAEIGDLTYDSNACVRCHRAGLEAVPAPGGAATTVPWFPHRTHLEATKSAKKSACVDCHEPDRASGGADYATLASASSCTKCHDHLETGENYRTTGGVKGAEVASCRNCHRADGGPAAPGDAVPPVGTEALGVARLTVSGAKGFQHHPRDRACGDCHVAGAESISSPDRVVAKVFRTDRGDSFVHAPPARATDPPAQPTDQETCLGCHWREQQQQMRLDPQSADVRRRLGDVLDGYPGWPDWPGWKGAPR